MSEFVNFSHSHGLVIRDLYPSDRIQRCPTVDHPSKRNGAYSWDGHTGWVMRWDGDGEIHWMDNQSTTWTGQDLQRWREKRIADESRRNTQALRAAEIAQKMMSEAELKSHNYLCVKGHRDVTGFVGPEDELYVPMRDVENNKLRGLQTIRWMPNERRWDKRMSPGMRAKGAVFRIGAYDHMPQWDARNTILCEGYATGLSIAAAVKAMHLRATVLVCFSAHNMYHVAHRLVGRVFVFADNDASQVGEDMARRIGKPYCMSDQVGEDANDLHQRDGLLAVQKLIMDMMR